MGCFSTVECIPTIFGLSYEDMVGVQQNTMKGEGKSSDNDKTHNKDIVGESYKFLESLSNRLDWIFCNKKNASIIVETTFGVKLARRNFGIDP